MNPTDNAQLEEHFDHTSERYAEDVVERYRELRSRCPVTHSDRHGGFWVISKYETIVAILRQPDIFISGEGILIPPLPFPVRGIPTESDGALHASYRGVFMPYLTPGATAGYEAVVRQRTTALLDDFIADGRADFMAKFATRLPGQVVAGLFGFESEDGERCYEWIATILAHAGGDPAAVADATQHLVGFIIGALSRARANPGDDLISAIVTHENGDGGRFSDEECVGLLFTVIAGALETTVSGLASSLLLIDRFPHVRAELIADLSLVGRAVEEVLRMESPVHSPSRTVTRDVELDGVQLHKGDRVLLLFGSGNYDDEKFTEPEQFNLHRSHNQHLTFGQGIHRCVGAPLAQLEMRVALEEVLRRMPDFHVCGYSGPTVHAGGTWGLSSLDIVFTPGPKVGVCQALV